MTERKEFRNIGLEKWELGAKCMEAKKIGFWRRKECSHPRERVQSREETKRDREREGGSCTPSFKKSLFLGVD